MTTPTQRSLALLREGGWTAEVVERWCPFSRRRKDLFGFVDIVAMKPGERPLLVQTTSASNLAARRQKIKDTEAATVALVAGFEIVLHGWAKRPVKRGGTAMRWRVKEETVT